MSRETAISRATRHFDDGTFIDDLARRVAIRSESQVPESRPHLTQYLSSEICPAFSALAIASCIDNLSRGRAIAVAEHQNPNLLLS
jgi:plasmid stability protein